MPITEEGTLEQILLEIEEHDRKYPKHGIGCACHDKHAGTIRRILQGYNKKSLSNLSRVLGYVMRDLGYRDTF